MLGTGMGWLEGHMYHKESLDKFPKLLVPPWYYHVICVSPFALCCCVLIWKFAKHLCLDIFGNNKIPTNQMQIDYHQYSLNSHVFAFISWLRMILYFSNI